MDTWRRKDYTMGLPEGSLLKAVKEGKSIYRFIESADDSQLIQDIATAMGEAIADGEVDEIIEEVMGDGTQ